VSIEDRLTNDMKTALRTGDKVRLSTIRLLRAQIKDREIERGRSLSDGDVLEVLTRAAKMRKEAIELYRQGGRTDLLTKEEAELKIIQSYMPEPLSRDELLTLINEVIQETGAQGPRDVGKVMGKVMSMVQGRAEGREVSQLVRERLMEE